MLVILPVRREPPAGDPVTGAKELQMNISTCRSMLARSRTTVMFASMGALLGVFVLHPVTMAIYWFESHTGKPMTAAAWWELVHRVGLTLTPMMLTMSALFALFGGLLGLGFGCAFQALLGKERMLRHLRQELTRDLPSLITAGEGERMEFKASARWDFRRGTVNRSIEDAVVRSIAGFLNHQGGNLLIGVADSGKIVGLQPDFQTLRRKDRDGFEQFITGLVEQRLGGNICSYVHIAFRQMDGHEVCRVVVEPSRRPVYCENGRVARYYLRTGNATRELDVREALDHIRRRWPSG